MRHLLMILPFTLLPLITAQAHEDGHDHGPLGAHEHGVAQLDAALEGQDLELELRSPAMNLVGFEHAASTDTDKAQVSAARKQLEQPLTLFNLPKAAGCKISEQELQSPLFADKPTAHDEHREHAKDEHHHEHSEIHAHYHFTCVTPAALTNLDLSRIFKAFPATQKIQLQLIGPSGQQGSEIKPDSQPLSF